MTAPLPAIQEIAFTRHSHARASKGRAITDLAVCQAVMNGARTPVRGNRAWCRDKETAVLIAISGKRGRVRVLTAVSA